MSVMPQLSSPAFTPLDMGYALTQRQDVGRLEYWGAVAGQVFERSIAGAMVRDIPPLMNVDAIVEQRLEDWRVGHMSSPLSPEDEAGLRAHFRTDAEQQRAQYTPMSVEEWQASPSFRDGIPYEEGMTVERAAGLAELYDDQAYRDWIRQNHDADWISTVGAVITSIASGMASPEVFIPVVGPELRLAIAARLGVVGGHAAAGAIEGAVGTALVLPFVQAQEGLIGREYTTSDMLVDVAIGALAGGVMGTGVGMLARRHTSALATRAEVVLTDARAAGEAIASVRLAQEQIINGRAVDVPPPSRAAVDAMLEGMSIEQRARFIRARQADAVSAAELEIRRIEAEQAGEILLRPETTLTPVEEAAIRGDTLETRTAAREQRAAEREARRSRRLEQDPERLQREARQAREQTLGPEAGARAADEAADVAARLRELSPAGGRRPVARLTKLERMALFDPDPELRRLAEAELDRRLAQDGTVAASRPARPQSIGRPARRAAPRERAPIEAVEATEEMPDVDEFAALDAAGRVTEAERTAMEQATEAERRVARASEAYQAAVACVLAA